MYRVAIDVGGTFTDLIAASDEGRIVEAKVPSNPEHPDEALELGLSELAALTGHPGLRELLLDTRLIIHGTTVGMNAVLQLSGAKTGLLCTAGFRDALEIRLGHKEQRYLFAYTPPRPLVPRSLRLPIAERIDKNGRVAVTLAEAEVEAAAELLATQGVEAVAISFLWSFLNPEHERRAEAIVRERLPEAFVSCSHDVLPKVREYNRTSTTVLNAYIGPTVKQYVEATEELLRRFGFAGRVRYMQSNGGLGEAAEVTRQPVLLLMSGPAAAPSAALHFRDLAGDNIITVDMGGTSFDASLVRDGLPDMRAQTDINRYRAALPLIDVRTIGAGGGSIAAASEGLLSVGPASAEAYPGPACYGRGGERPTVTDANVVMGWLNQDALLGGRFPIDAGLSHRAIEDVLATPLGMTTNDAAIGVVELISRQMADAIRDITVRRGHDPRDFTLLVGGGAGGAHAASVAQVLEIRRILIPRIASALCAFGAAVADLRHDYTLSTVGRLRDLDLAELERTYARLERRGEDALAAEHVAAGQMRLARSLDLRYKDQVYECTIDVSGVDLGRREEAVAELEARFHRRHQELYEFSQPGFPCEVIALGVSARAHLQPLEAVSEGPTASGAPEPVLVRPMLFERGAAPAGVPVYAGESMLPGHVIAGPAVIEESHTTIVIPPHGQATLRPEGVYVIELAFGAAPAGSRGADAVDAVTRGVIAGALGSIAREMTHILQRTARSPVLAIGNDFSNAVYTLIDGVPEMVVQGEDQPVHLGGMLESVKNAAKWFEGRLAPGDVIVRNEPSLGGSHLPDIDVIEPIFAEDALIGFACSRAHMGDIGGSVPGGFNPEARDLFSEGLVIPPIKLISAGETDEDLWNMILANVRTPELMRGDMGAQISAVHIAVRRIGELVAKYGVGPVSHAMGWLIDRGESLMRAQIAAMPDGRYRGSAWIQEDGHGAPAAELVCEIVVAGDELQIAVESPPTCQSYRNSYWGATAGAIYFGVLSAIEPGLPVNEGLYRPLRLDLGPLGTMLNAAPPAACGLSTANPWENVFEAVTDAMSKIVPGRACAGWAHVCCSSVSGTDPRYGEPYGGLMHVTYHGGAGAVSGADGGPLWGAIVAAGAPQVGDIELLELRLPLHFHRYELAQDSACPGRWRGGSGAVLELEIVDHDAVVTHFGDGTLYPPPSRLGGGSPADLRTRVHTKAIIRSGGIREPLPLHAVVTAHAGERLLVMTPGGGGVGDPHERPSELVSLDAQNGLISVASARDEYAVILDPVSFDVDADATAALRQKPDAGGEEG